MNKQTVATFIKAASSAISKHSPEILMGFGTAGMITTTILAVKATPKALKLIEAKKKAEQKEKLSSTETLKAAWKCYIPAALTGAASITCLIGSTSVSSRRTAALAAAYQISETALTEYKEKVVEVIGEKKAEDIRTKISEDRLEKQPVTRSNVIVTGNGTTLCMDYYSGQYFESSIDAIKSAKNEINATMTRDWYVSLNDLYDELDIEHTEMGYELGWNLDGGLLDIEFDYGPAKDGRPCLVMHYSRPPKYNFSSMM